MQIRVGLIHGLEGVRVMACGRGHFVQALLVPFLGFVDDVERLRLQVKICSHDALEVVGGFDARLTHTASSGHAKGDLALLGLCRE